MAASSANRNVRTKEYKAQLARLPERIRRLADAAFREFLKDPSSPGLALHDLQDHKRGQHRSGSKAVSVTLRYRAIYVEDGGDNVWYWIGSHSDYNVFTGRN